MIEMKGLTKTFEKNYALKEMSCKIEKGSIFGLIGSNGAGKSTLLRIIAGVYRPDGGTVTIDGQTVYENTNTKNRVFFVGDTPYYFQGATLNTMAKFYSSSYKNWSDRKYMELLSVFPINPGMKIATMSKGMQRQCMMILALSCQPDILLLDEAFDGLDPVIRQLVKKMLSNMVNDGASVIISSHNLRELEDLCDHVGLLHLGGVVFERELDSAKLGLHKLHAAFSQLPSPDQLNGLNLVKIETRGSLINLVARGDRDEIMAQIETLNPLFSELLPLTLEEVFIHEMENIGYDFSNLIQ